MFVASSPFNQYAMPPEEPSSVNNASARVHGCRRLSDDEARAHLHEKMIVLDVSWLFESPVGSIHALLFAAEAVAGTCSASASDCMHWTG